MRKSMVLCAFFIALITVAFIQTSGMNSNGKYIAINQSGISIMINHTLALYLIKNNRIFFASDEASMIL